MLVKAVIDKSILEKFSRYFSVDGALACGVTEYCYYSKCLLWALNWCRIAAYEFLLK